jgi:hypothetical protein
MRLLHFPTIGWLIVPERNTLSSVVLQYRILDNNDEFKELYDGLIVEDINGKPNLVKVNNICSTNYDFLIYYTGIQLSYSSNILSQNNLKLLLSVDEFIRMMNASISLFEMLDNYSNEMPSWSLENWLEYSGAEIVN